MNARPTETRATFDLCGSSMSVLRKGDGPPVLLAHSFLSDAEMWRPQIDALSGQFSVIAPDLWGHGASGPMPHDARDLQDIARHHLALLDALEIGRCAVVGLSVGGMWAAELALLAPGRITALVLMDTFLGPEPVQKRDLYYAFLDQVAATESVPTSMVDRLAPLFFGAHTLQTRPDLVQAFGASLVGWPKARLRDSIAPLGRMIFGRRDALEDLERLKGPVLVMTGAEDLSRPPAEGRLMADRMGCPFIEIDRAGHISALEQPEEVTTALLDFLTGRHDRA